MTYYMQPYITERDHKAIKVVERGSCSHSWSIFSILHVPGGGKRLWAEIRFPDAGKDEREMPAETGGSWGVWAWVGALWVWPYYCYLEPSLPGTLLTSSIKLKWLGGKQYPQWTKKSSNLPESSQSRSKYLAMQCYQLFQLVTKVELLFHMLQCQMVDGTPRILSVETTLNQPCFCLPPNMWKVQPNFSFSRTNWTEGVKQNPRYASFYMIWGWITRSEWS